MYFIGIGSNDVNHEKILSNTLNYLDHIGEGIGKRSALYTSPAWPDKDATQPDYLNCVACIDTTDSPHDLLHKLHDIENIMGRVRHQRWGSRTVDLDILAYNDAILPDIENWHRQAGMSVEQARQVDNPPLTIPHPRLCMRAFALVPLLEICPAWIHPVYKEGGAQLLQRVPVDQLTEIEKRNH